MRRVPLARTAPPARKTPLRANRKMPARTQYAWREGMEGKRCVLCHAVPAYGHHIIEKQALRAKADELRDPDSAGKLYARLVADTRNRLALCADCHMNHHAGARRVPRDALRVHAASVWVFARELGMEWYLDRHYRPAPIDMELRRATVGL